MNTLRHSSQADVMHDTAKQCSYHQTIGLFWHSGCRGKQILCYMQPLTHQNCDQFCSPNGQLGWDVRRSSNTQVPELYLLFEMVYNYGLVNSVQNEHENGIITNFWTCLSNCSRWPVIHDKTPEVFSSRSFVTRD